MFGRIACIAITLSLFCGRSESRADSAKDDLQAFQGTWQLLSAKTEGKYTPDDVVSKIRVAIKGNSHTVTMGDQVLAHDESFTLDPTKSPKEVTDTLNDAANKGKQIKGIYKIEGDLLISCVGAIGGDRPTTFEAKAGTGHILRYFRRVKPGEDAKTPAVLTEQKNFGGTWRFKSMEMAGQQLPEEGFKDIRMVMTNNQFSMTGGGPGYQGIYVVDPTTKPKTIDIIFTEGSTKGGALFGVYSLEGDVYTVCLGMDGKSRPKSLESKPGTGHVLEVLTREKP